MQMYQQLIVCVARVQESAPFSKLHPTTCDHTHSTLTYMTPTAVLASLLPDVTPEHMGAIQYTHTAEPRHLATHTRQQTQSVYL